MVNSKTKKIGQVFTPQAIVASILDYCLYGGERILDKHVIDNSCGNGAFLKEVVKRYITAARSAGRDDERIKADLQTYVHGIDNDRRAYEDCRQALSDVAEGCGISDVAWDVRYASALSLRDFDGKMDYVVGNPPYVRVHNLDETYDEVKRFRFAQGGMTDLYLAFFELGFEMLAPHGTLAYITPSSWLNSVAAANMRQYIFTKKNLLEITDLGHYQAFDGATAYTMISLFQKDRSSSEFDYYTYNGKDHTRTFVSSLQLKEIYTDGYFYLGSREELSMLREVRNARPARYVSVKNGFATLADNVFIGDHIPASHITIPIVKASTGKRTQCLFPYDRKGKPLSREDIFGEPCLREHFLAHKEDLLKGREEQDGWYLYGRTQALSDVYKRKLSVNALMRDEHDFKLIELPEGEGIYSGLYVLPNVGVSLSAIKKIIASPEFVGYVKVLKKYKSGGYYTFNSKDLEAYINYIISKDPERYVCQQQDVSQRRPSLFQEFYQ